jgi:xylulokinase
MFVHSDEVQVDPDGRLHTFCHAVRDKWHMMGVTLTAGGALGWFVDTMCQELDKTSKGKVYEVLNQEAAEIPPGCEGLFFLPYMAGERTPHADPDARGCFIGLTLKHTRGHMVRAIMEGVAFAMRDSLAIINDLNVPVKQVRVSGGGSKSPLWRQIQADVFGKPAVTINAEQGPAFGVALLAAVGAGEYKNIAAACSATISETSKTPVIAKNRKQYDQLFPVFQQFYRSLAADFKTISQVSK